MGTEYLIADHKNKRLYDLGKTYHDREGLEEFLRAGPWTEEEFVPELGRHIYRYAEIETVRLAQTLDELDTALELEPNVDIAHLCEFGAEIYRFCSEADWNVTIHDDGGDDRYDLRHEKLYAFAGSIYTPWDVICPGCGARRDKCNSILNPVKHGALVVQIARGTQVLLPTIDLFLERFSPFVLLAEKEVGDVFDVEKVYRSGNWPNDLSIEVTGPDDRDLSIVVWGPLAGDKEGAFALETQGMAKDLLGEDWLDRFEIFPRRLRGAHQKPPRKGSFLRVVMNVVPTEGFDVEIEEKK